MTGLEVLPPPTQRLLGEPLALQPFMQAAELRSLAAPTDGPDVEVLARTERNGISTTELTFLTDAHQGRPIRMHGYISRPVDTAAPLPPLLLIPGGGRRPRPRPPTGWRAKLGVTVLGVDWIGVGTHRRSRGSTLGGTPSTTTTTSVRPFRCTTCVLSAGDRGAARADGVDRASRLGVIGNSWGGFYTLLLGGIDPRFRSPERELRLRLPRPRMPPDLARADGADGARESRDLAGTFDPGRRAHLSTADVLYAQATNDRYFSLEGRCAPTTPSREKRACSLRETRITRCTRTSGSRCSASAIAGPLPPRCPSRAAWVPGTTTVEVTRSETALRRVRQRHVLGREIHAVGRAALAGAVARRGDSWTAEIPIVDSGREMWFYGHADDARRMAASSPVLGRPVRTGLRASDHRPCPDSTSLPSPFGTCRSAIPTIPSSASSKTGGTGLTITFDDADELRALPTASKAT